ncbi:MAG: hypothetical protein JWQ84_1734 [Mucilaginibacter sp.]|nr:hypothetical protein [Mucilaginibacter sp.]MDB5016902.1 hypothetical protein [Mucilaginibacter sp.]MDB5138712.1 hypothetical protein [Mucilaginibacter sp.]
MLSFLKNHPFCIEAFFDYSIVLTFAFPKKELEHLIPECLKLDTFNDEWAFIAVAVVKTVGLRPKGLPEFLGNDFTLVGYRAFVKYKSHAEKRLRGLYILKSETDKKMMQMLGNVFSQYSYTATDIQELKEQSTLKIKSIQSKFNIEAEISKNEVRLPIHSPFLNWKDARRFAGPLPFTFSYNIKTKNVLIIEGVRKCWVPKEIKIESYNIPFFEAIGLKNGILASAFMVNEISYTWKKGILEKWAH